jgi:hypothetical protein
MFPETLPVSDRYGRKTDHLRFFLKKLRKVSYLTFFGGEASASLKNYQYGYALNEAKASSPL